MSDQGDALSRVRNRAASLADAVRRLHHARQSYVAALEGARVGGATQEQIDQAVRIACAGRPDRAQALNSFARALGGDEE